MVTVWHIGGTAQFTHVATHTFYNYRPRAKCLLPIHVIRAMKSGAGFSKQMMHGDADNYIIRTAFEQTFYNYRPRAKCLLPIHVIRAMKSGAGFSKQMMHGDADNYIIRTAFGYVGEYFIDGAGGGYRIRDLSNPRSKVAVTRYARTIRLSMLSRLRVG